MLTERWAGHALNITMGLRHTLRISLVLLLWTLCCANLLADGRPAASGKGASRAQKDGTQAQGTFWLIPHTHWEGAVFKTREEYLEIGLPHILKAPQLLQAYPEYRFVLDQVAYVRPFLERYPDQAATFRRFVAEGKIELVGAQNIMPDVNTPSGESWIRQVLYGKSYYREKLGADVTVGWGLDSFGHHPQMPQLLKLAGYRSYWFQRGVRNDGTPSEFLWEGIDGTKIPAFWLPFSYALFHPAPGNLFEFENYARQQWADLGRYSKWPDRVALVGADVTEPEEMVPVMVRKFNQKGNAPFILRFGVPTDFEKAVANRGDSRVVSGELNPIFQGVYSSRIELKQWLRNLELMLTTAESVRGLTSWLGTPAAKDDLTKAWEPVLFNQAHDLISGTMVDKVYEETIRGYQSSKSLADGMIETDLDAIAARIDTRGEGVPVIVFNNLGWRRTDIAEVEVDIAEPGVRAVRLFDASGQSVPVQYLATQRDGDGGIRHAKIAFLARDVPALGYSLYRIVPDQRGGTDATSSAGSARRPTSTMHDDSGFLENEFYRATFDLWTGELTRLQVKSGDWNALGEGSANVVAREQDGGDLWELYGTLNGARLTPMTRKHGLPAPARTHLSNEWIGGDEPGVTSDLGLELGVERSFDYALVPHEGDWRAAEIYRAGWEFNHPLAVRKVTTYAGKLPKRWGLLELSRANVAVSALKPGADGTVVLRVYEAAGRASSAVKIKFNAGISSARESNLIEENGRELRTADNAIQFDLGAYEIKTFKLKLLALVEIK